MQNLTLNSDDSIAQLRRSWAIFIMISLIFVSCGAWLMSTAWQGAAALRWSLLTSVVLFYLAVVLWRNLNQNRRSETDPLSPGLGWGNWITLLRGVLTAGVAGFLLLPRPEGWLAWLPAILYSLAVIADALDGFFARRFNQVTRLGSILDLSFDGLGVLAAALLLVVYDRVPPWYALVALARYLFLAGQWLLTRSGKNLYPLPPKTSRRILASLQFVFIAVVLYPVFIPPLTWFAAIFFGIPFLIGFVSDFLIISGTLRPAAGLKSSLPYLPAAQIALRTGLVILTLLSFRQTWSDVLGDAWLGPALLFVQLFAALFVFLGIAGRISAGFALVALGLSQWFFPPSIIQILQIAGYTAVLFLSTGPFSLWSPEEAWYERPIGTRQPSGKRQIQNDTTA
jgi:CDP-diacylglycerol--glycerol-3-phosphate 3-phosphatidyltransferase